MPRKSASPPPSTAAGQDRGPLVAAGYSRYARERLAAQPELAPQINHPPLCTAEDMRRFIAERLAQAPLESTLRQLRQRVLLALMERDLTGQATLTEVCATMTALAEVAIAAALEALVPELEAKMGVPHSPAGERQQFIVVGMGKLGGGELNVSSDIDLVFVYPEDGETVGGQQAGTSNHEFFAALGQRLIALLAAVTHEGFVFRVDMRLRPWGDAGPLALSFDALEQYLVMHGREWERYAWIKGRPVSGEASAQRALAALVRPFVFRKYLDYGAYGAMRELHAQIREEVARREMAANVKLGPGGIREIEFIAQVFQLIRGGRETELQVRPTLTVLELLARRGLLERQDVQVLADAYDFLRRLEHRLQYLDDAQTHELPQDDQDRRLVAKAMGARGWKDFLRRLDAHRQAVAERFERIFSTQQRERHALAPLWTNAEDREAGLEALGFGDPGNAAERLASIQSGSRYQSLPESSRERVNALVPALIERAARRPNPDATLARALDLLETVSRRAAYLALLDEHPLALDRLAELVSASPWAAEYLNRHPVLLDELLDARLLLARPDWRAVGRELRRGLMELAGQGDVGERQMDALRETHHTQLFHLLLQDLAGALSVEALADHLSELADLMLQVTLEVCWLQLKEKTPELPAEPRFAVIGYGKLGGKELGYVSDLDLVFLYDEEEAEPEVVAAYGRLGQRINTWLNTRTAAGQLFETDMRLRPDGAAGLMVSSLSAFRRYQRESAWTWEHQALTRARYCAGEAAVGAVFEEERCAMLRRERAAGELANEVRAMRQTMLEALAWRCSGG